MRNTTKIKWMTYAALLLAAASPISSTVMAVDTTNKLQTTFRKNEKNIINKTRTATPVSTKHITPTIDWTDWDQEYHGKMDIGMSRGYTVEHTGPKNSVGDFRQRYIQFYDFNNTGSTIPTLNVNKMIFNFTSKDVQNLTIKSDLKLTPSYSGSTSMVVPQANMTIGGTNNNQVIAPLNSKLELKKDYDIDFLVDPGYYSVNDAEWKIDLDADIYETQLTKVLYLDAATGEKIGEQGNTEEYLGKGLGENAQVTATALDFSSQGYDYSNQASLITADGTTELTGNTVNTNLKLGDLNNPNTPTGKQVIVFWYNTQSKVTAKDATIYVGDSWKPEDNFDSAVDTNGSDLTYDEFIATGGTVDSSKVDVTKVGDYPVTYSLGAVTDTGTVHVLENKQSITGSDVTKRVGDALPDDSEFNAMAVGKDGANISVTLDKSKVDMSQAGDYDVVVTADDGQTKTIQVHVLADQRSVNGSDVTKYVGEAIPGDSEFKTSATDIDGKSEGVTIDKSQVDMSTPGDYDVVITSDSGLTKTVKVHVLADQRSIEGSDVIKYVGDTMPDDSEFKASATDRDGKDITVTLDKSKVDMSKAGDYDVVITSKDGQTKTVVVHVLPNLQDINGSDVTKHVGDALPDDSEFKASAIGKDGQPVNVNIDKLKVDMNTAGDYPVLITSDDGQLKTVTVHVLPDLRTINGDSLTRYAGDALPNDAEFKASATDIDGNSIAVTIDKSKVDMSKIGDYDVIITATDGQTKTIQVHVREHKVIPEDSTVIVEYVDQDGNQIAKDDILMGHEGDKYTTKAKDVDGYELVNAPKNKEGIFVKGTTKVVYGYQKVKDEDPAVPNKPVTPKGDNNKTVTTSKKKLPQTGEAILSESILSIFGLVTLLTSYIVIRRRKNKSKNLLQ